jgi:TRAP-type C4-dicarboxylate transport system permease small subunit
VIDRILEAICAALLAATVLITFIAVIFRYVIGASLSWSFEASLALLTYLTFVGCYLAMRKNAHLKVEVLVSRFPALGQALVFTLNQCVILAIAAVMVIYGVRQMVMFHSQTTLVTELPLSLLYAAVPLSGVLMALQSITELFGGIGRWRRREPVFMSNDEPPTADV